jgi:hypothetical protein
MVLLLTISFQSSAWGPTGHRVTGAVAEKYLSKKARRAIGRILDGQSLAVASTWMDEIRSDATYDYMADWHWVTIPDGHTYRSSARNTNGDIIETLERIIRELKSKTLNTAEETERLKMLIHLVGDLHQPLHVGTKDDRGGNDIKVRWFGNASNLHKVWDSDMIDDTRLSYTELAASLEIPPADAVRQWQTGTVEIWAAENQAYEKTLYDYGDGRLGYRYSYVNLPVVRKRLLQAGVRLAGIINDLYG